MFCKHPLYVKSEGTFGQKDEYNITPTDFKIDVRMNN